jgi:thiamine biosynthesis lipoprotein
MNKRHSQIVIVIILVCLVVAFYFSVVAAGPVKVDSGYRVVMGTFARVVAVAKDSDKARSNIQVAFAEIEKVDELMSDYKSDSEIGQVNRDGFKRAVEVSESTYEVLQRSIEFSKLTGGAFDITVGPLVDLFRSGEKKGITPGEEAIAQAKMKVGFQKLQLDGKKRAVKFAVEGMRLDLGGIAKGYAIDKAVEAMQKCGASGGMVDIGGDIRCFGTPPKGRDHWLIGVQDPNVTDDDIGTGQLLSTLKLTNAAVATSGGYRRFVLIDGKKYSHIIDTDRGSSANELASVTIISKDAISADALATAVSVMGCEKGLALIEELPETEAILIPAFAGVTSQAKYQLIKTGGAGKYIE